MCHTSVRGKSVEFVLVPGISQNLQPILLLLLGEPPVNYHHEVGVCHRCDDLSSVQCLVTDNP